ncbi:MAG TPA: hypothetical protein PKM88_12530 [bacterium]|nr:hypothetical protein [bacterium]
MNISIKKLWTKIQNYVDPILAGIITLTVLNLAGMGLAYYVTELPPNPHPKDPVVAAEVKPYEAFFSDEAKPQDLPEKYEELLSVNFFDNEVGGSTIGPPPPIVPDSTGRVPPPAATEEEITDVTYHGGVIRNGQGVAQLSTPDANDGAVFMVRVGNAIPGTDITLQEIKQYYVVLSRPGFKNTQVPVKGAVQVEN